MGDFAACHLWLPGIWRFPRMVIPPRSSIWKGFLMKSTINSGDPPWRAGNLQWQRHMVPWTKVLDEFLCNVFRINDLQRWLEAAYGHVSDWKTIPWTISGTFLFIILPKKGTDTTNKPDHISSPEACSCVYRIPQLDVLDIVGFSCKQSTPRFFPCIYIMFGCGLVEGNLEAKPPTICRDGKAEAGRVSEEKSRSEKIKDGESQKKEDAGARKGREVAIHCAEPAGQRRDEKVHAVVARSTFPSLNVQNTPAPDHFWKLRCRKSARRCGAKHVSRSKWYRHGMFGPLFDVEMSKKCAPLWRETHFQVKMYEPWRYPTPFTRTCANRMAHRLPQTWIIFCHLKFPMAHRWSKWPNSEAGNLNISIYYALNKHLFAKSWQPYSSQNYHPPHGAPRFMVFPTYKLGCDRHYIPVVSLISSTSWRRILSSTCPWHTADRIDFLFSYYLLIYDFGFFRTASRPFTNLFILCRETKTCPEAAAQAATAAAPAPTAADQAADQADQAAAAAAADQEAESCWTLQTIRRSLLGAGSWLAAFNEVRTTCERGPNEVQNQNLGDWSPKLA